jgi:8-oxo-dGTP pyrophosphatase MutT (NUDIX family)
MEEDFLRRVERLFKPVDAWGEFRKGARAAAVTFILYRQSGRWMVPFVRRRRDLRDHPGQVALPGGSVEPGESAWAAAQREVAEEIGVPAGRLAPLGAGDTIYAAVTNFSVVLAIPLDRLLDDSAWVESDTPWRFRYLAHEESVVWGLTERIVYGLAPRLRQALEGS